MKKNKRGRPTKYNPLFSQELGELIKKRSALTINIIAAYFKVDRDTIYEWAKVHPDFSDSLKKAQTFTAASLETTILKAFNSNEKRQNPALDIFLLKSQCGYRDDLNVFDETKNKTNEKSKKINYDIPDDNLAASQAYRQLILNLKENEDE